MATTGSALPPPPARPEELVAWDQWWRSGADRALATCASSGHIFSADVLRDDPYNLPEPRHPSAWGALFSAARAAGLIEHVGYDVSHTPSRRGGLLRTWRGRPHQVLRTTT